MKKNNPLVSIIMNCHNGEKYLKDSLNSILKQTYKNWELIFWDNKSTDNTSKIVKKISNKKIKYFYGRKFVKLCEARNLAVKKASGDFVCFLDTDDIWNKNYIKKHLKKIILEKCDIVYSKYLIKNEIDGSTYINENKLLPSGMITNSLLKNYLVGISAVFVKRNIFNKIKFKPKYQIIGDFDFFLRLSLIRKFYSLQDPLLTYRHHKNNFTNTHHNLLITELQTWLKENEKNLKGKYDLQYFKLKIIKLKFKNFIRRFYSI